MKECGIYKSSDKIFVSAIIKERLRCKALTVLKPFAAFVLLTPDPKIASGKLNE